ncbi:MAG: hypothetical protein WB998_12785 [Solirubrobacteraceae bacterium]
MVLGLLARDRQALLDLFLDLLADGCDLLGRQLDRAVEVLDCFLDGTNRHVPGTAAWTPGLVAQATEVLIDPAVAAMASVDQPPAAVAAED